MKRAGQRSRLAAIEAALAPGGAVIKIEGGVPDALASKPADPVQLELPLPGLAPPQPRRWAAADPGANKTPDWEQAWWQDQRRRRDLR